MHIVRQAGAVGFGGGRPIATENLLRWQKRREPLPGFPWDGEFKSRSEVEEYFAGDTVTCLLCGREFKSLGEHIGKIHGVAIDDYKQRYNLPYNRGLCSQARLEQCSSLMKDRTPEQKARGVEAILAGRESDKYRAPRHSRFQREGLHRNFGIERVLTEDMVKQIRAADGTQQEIAEQFGTSQSYVSEIKLRKVWAHV